jgi:hypothetical protein
MEPDKKVDEKAILIQQYVAFFIALVLFLPLGFLITLKYSLLVTIVIESYIGFSSIINRVSIIKPKGRLAHSRGKEAVIYGIVMLIGAFIGIVIILWLPTKFFAF